jgi:hypothetical protein
MVLEEDARILFDGAVYAIRLHLPTTPTLFEHAASSCGSARSGSTIRASIRADQVLKRDRYVAKTTTATATQATTYSVEVSPVVLLITVSRTSTKLLTTIRITYPPIERHFSMRGTYIHM